MVAIGDQKQHSFGSQSASEMTYIVSSGALNSTHYSLLLVHKVVKFWLFSNNHNLQQVLHHHCTVTTGC